MRWIGIRKYSNAETGDVLYDKIIIEKTVEEIPCLGAIVSRDRYDVECYERLCTPDSSGTNFGLWSTTLGSAKRLALQDTGLKSKDFEWQIIQ